MIETNRALPVLSKIGIICGVGVAFILGLTGTVYLSLRSSEVSVPDILGKNYLTGEEMLDGAGLNIRKRASRFSPDAKPDTILDQSPRAGDVIKAGQTVAVVVSRPPKEGEAATFAAQESKANEKRAADEANANDNSASKNGNTNKDQKPGKDARNKNSNAKSNANSNRNANNRNANGNANNSNGGNRNANSARNANAANSATNANSSNRNANNLNSNKRAPVLQTPPFNPTGNTRKP
ncbi:MAG: PASTA domain-containing protein [Pyrinomonadaceae bacterium]